MIVKFKMFENNYNDVIYRCADFVIREDFTYESMFVASDIISRLPILINENHPNLNDDNLKNLEITEKYKHLFSLHTIYLYDTKIKNLGEYKSGLIGHFFYNRRREDLEKINPDVYRQLVLKYYPIIDKIVNNSDNIGDVIIKYENLIPRINEDLDFFTQTNKYNL